MDEILKKKNILDLQFQKNLVIASTSLIVAFSYLLGVGITFLTQEISLDDINQMSALAVISFGVLGICYIFLHNSIFHLNNILELIKKL